VAIKLKGVIMMLQDEPKIMQVYKEIDLVGKEFRLKLFSTGDELMDCDEGSKYFATCNDDHGVIMSAEYPRIKVYSLDNKSLCNVEVLLPKQFRTDNQVKVNISSKSSR
jgi:hypothetical protein